MLWIPSHVDIPGNEIADELAGLGSAMDQSKIPVTQNIIKARIKCRKWNIQHGRAARMYGDRQSPKMDVEKRWPPKPRKLYARLRTGHAKELKSYRHSIESEEDGMCENGCGVDETIEHVLCHCNATSAARTLNWNGPVDTTMLITHPEICRRILKSRFPELVLAHDDNLNSNEPANNTSCSAQGVRCHHLE